MAFKPDRLRLAREKRNLTQRDLGHLCNLGVNQINRYENGLNDPSTEILSLIARHLNVTTDYLLGLTDEPQGYMTESLRNDERQLLDAYTTGDLATIIRLVSQRIDTLTGAAEG